MALASRKQNPQLREVVNTWIRKHGPGDGFRNELERGYLKSVKYVKTRPSDGKR